MSFSLILPSLMVAGETSLKIVVRVREPAGVGARELSPVLGFRGGLRRARNRVLTFRTARDACQTCNNDAENRHYAANTDDNISQHRLPITCTHANSPCRTSAVARARLRMTFDMLELTCRKLSSVFHRLMSTSAHAANTPLCCSHGICPVHYPAIPYIFCVRSTCKPGSEQQRRGNRRQCRFSLFLHCGYSFLYPGDAPLTSCSHCFVLQQTMQILVVKIATRPSLLVIGS